jgi:hypothetical protein
MRVHPAIIAAIGGVLDAFVAAFLFALGFTLMGAFMAAVAVLIFALAVVLWRRGG